MQEYERQLLQRYFDGETAAEDSQEAKRLIERDSEAKSLWRNWTQQRDALSGREITEDELQIETDWNRLKAQLLTEDESPETDSPQRRGPVLPVWFWGAAAAFVALVSVLFFLPRSNVDPAANSASANVVDTVETDLKGVSPIVFVDAETGWSVVWVDEAAAG